MDFPLHPNSDYFASTFKLVVEPIHGAALDTGEPRPRRHVKPNTLRFFTESSGKAVPAAVDGVIPSSEMQRDFSYGDEARQIVDQLLRILCEPQIQFLARL